jgi:NCS2 family nucleobase:cation symporter-2
MKGNLIYGVNDRPPALICLVNGAQQLTTIAPFLIYTIVVMNSVGATTDEIANVVSLTFLACGIGTLLQAWPGTGSGYLIGIAPAAAYIPVSITALKFGGMPLLVGMTLLAALFEIVFAQLVRRFRPFFPAEISGLCILLIGVFVGILAVRATFGLDPATLQPTATPTEFAVTAGTLALMIGLNLWAKGAVRMLCAIIGVTCGYVAAVLLGAVDPFSMRAVTTAAIVDLPDWWPVFPIFRADLVVPFMAAALTCALRAMGDVSAAQKINDRSWVRPEMTSIRKGMVANGLSTVFSAVAGVLGGNTQSSTIGMSNATGVTSRFVAYWLGGILIVLSLLPVVSAILVAMPRAVVGAMLLFTTSFIMISGLQIITSRLLDARRTFIVGIALTASLSREIFPQVYENAPAMLKPMVSSGLVLGLLTALILNALFRIGVRTRAQITIERGPGTHEAIGEFLVEQGARWGARQDVIQRAVFCARQAMESIFEHCRVDGPAVLEASFDEFNLDVRISYRGEAFVLPETRPSEEEVLEDEAGDRLLAGYLIRRSADRVRAIRRPDDAVLEFHFQH